MGELFQPMHLMILFLVYSIFFLIPYIFYLLTLNKALKQCDPSSRRLEPVMIWLCLVPLVGLVMNFLVIHGLAESLRNEFARRQLQIAEQSPGYSQGLGYSICACCTMVPLLNMLAWIPTLIFWMLYWVKINEYSNRLVMQSYQSAGNFEQPV
jgi:hypothetical protein